MRAGLVSRLGQAVRTPPPVGHFSFVDLIAALVGRGETWRGTNRAFHVDHSAADAANQMVMIVADAIFEPRW
jgi:hypothetical protein